MGQTNLVPLSNRSAVLQEISKVGTMLTDEIKGELQKARRSSNVINEFTKDDADQNIPTVHAQLLFGTTVDLLTAARASLYRLVNVLSEAESDYSAELKLAQGEQYKNHDAYIVDSNGMHQADVIQQLITNINITVRTMESEVQQSLLNERNINMLQDSVIALVNRFSKQFINRLVEDIHLLNNIVKEGTLSK